MQESKLARLKNRAKQKGYILHNAAYILENENGRQYFQSLNEIENFFDELDDQAELDKFNRTNGKGLVARFAKN